MYLIGVFQRDDIILGLDIALQAELVRNVDKSHLMKAREDLDYQVINLETKEYYDPSLNKWVPIKGS